MTIIRLIAIVLVTSSLLNGQAPTSPKFGQSHTPKPQLPVADDNACPGKGRATPVKLWKDYRLYSSWKSDGKPIGMLKAGEEVTGLSGVNLTREPDVAVIKSDVGSGKVGGTALSYGIEVVEVDPQGVWDAGVVLWSNGVWFTVDPERVAEKGVCGLGSFGPSGCSVDIIKFGVSEWWVEVKTNSGLTGWVQAEQLNSDFAGMCHFYED